MGENELRLALGTVQFGLSYGITNRSGQVPVMMVKDMLNLAYSNGIDLLDTAIAYGESEIVLGQHGVQDFGIVTKLPPIPTGCVDIKQWVEEQVDSSIIRLGVKKLYGVLLHRPDQLNDPNYGQMLYWALQELKEKRVTQKIGISIYSPNELEFLIPKFSMDLVQAPFNLVDRRIHKTGWLRHLKDKGIEIHARSAFLQGLLLIPSSLLPERFISWSPLWNTWSEWLSTHPVSPIRACLSFLLAFPEIDRIIVGADNLEQLEQIILASREDRVDGLPNIQCDDEYLINPSLWSR